ncbi:GNAT family N-acetyltransferase [Priestia taiwanensis]|uniref:N-acetyltransferase domain-containing protein n=1 Tax=Priestia taiwanensis TaxID=1347902 RepID=A0A917EQI4_9BACI|nr:GNAT family N-acetyltransferase [Priestia taiwanensis]MBM7364123.1 RimJ/RimL family protein N-acetyltransferase [Priestia taiwanensis]GGE71748.1 hypothetical protein GCM10007140_22170 [Priestia taiwanensis]
MIRHIVENSEIRLREIEVEDLEFIRQLRNHDDIRKYFINQAIITEEQQRKWFLSYEQSTTDIMFVIEEKNNDNRRVGTLALCNVDMGRNFGELGRGMIGKEGRGNNYYKKAMTMLCHYGIQVLGMKTLYGEILEFNAVPLKVVPTIGFDFTGKKDDLVLIELNIERFYEWNEAFLADVTTGGKEA